MRGGKSILIPRRVLLVEIERRCREPQCNARVRIGLTKEEARLYCGFDCERCERHWTDSLSERDVPDWWEEIAVTDLYTLQEHAAKGPYEPSETVKRINRTKRQVNGE